MTDNLSKIQQRTFQYWFVDGLTEMGMGILFFFLGAFFWALGRVPENAFLNIAFLLAAFGWAFVLRWGLQKIKERSTYPRTGYVTYKRQRARDGYFWAAVIFAVVLTAVQFILIIGNLNAPAWMPAIEGLIVAYIFGSIAYRTGLARFYFLAAFGLVNGVVLALGGLGEYNGAAVLSALTGLVLLVFGGLTRLAYLRQNPLGSEDADEH